MLSYDCLFPSTITLRPEFESIAVDQILLNEFLECCRIAQQLDFKVNVQYDTTFNLTDYYVSVLSWVHPFLINTKGRSPPIPLFYFFHQRKFTETHQAFFNFFSEKVGSMCRHIFIITDCEDAMRTAIKTCLAKYNIVVIRCWLHLSKSIERWLHVHGGRSDVGYYVTSVREIILQNTKENFDMVLAEKSVAWDQKFLAYFNNNILTDIDSIAKYKIIAHVGHYFNLKSGKYTVFSVNDHSASYLTCLF
jgi:hypothetical protein